MSFNTTFEASSGNDIGSLISQILCENPDMASKARKRTAEAFQSIVRRSLGKTGSTIFRELKKGLKFGGFGLVPKTVYTKTGAVISEMFSRYRPDYSGKIPRAVTKQKPVGSKLFGLMQYYMNDKDTKDLNLEVGLIPSRRGGQKWAKNFSDWQEGGEINVRSLGRYDRRTMYGYWRKLGMPLAAGTILKRPARPVISRVQQDMNPAKLFEQFFLERLNR